MIVSRENSQEALHILVLIGLIFSCTVKINFSLHYYQQKCHSQKKNQCCKIGIYIRAQPFKSDTHRCVMFNRHYKGGMLKSNIIT